MTYLVKDTPPDDLTTPAIDRRAEQLRLLHMAEEIPTEDDFAGYTLTQKGWEATEKSLPIPF